MKYENLTVKQVAQKKYNSSKKGKDRRRKYRQSTKGKIAEVRSVLKWRQTESGRILSKKARKKYEQTEKGKIVLRKGDSKSKAKRRRNLQWILMFENPFDNIIEIDYHHITDVYVVALPRELHKLYIGYKNHREMTMDIVKQIYLKGD